MALIQSPKCLARAVLLLAGLVSLGLFTPQVSGGESTINKCSVNSFRLPRRIEPKHYDLVIEPNFDNGTFKGVVRINVRSGKLDKKQSASCMSSWKNHIFPSKRDPNQVNICDPSNIILHADKQIVLSEINFKLEDDKDKIKMTGICRDLKNEMIVINLNRPLGVDSSGQFKISFQGPIRDDLRGFHKSEYNDATTGQANGAKKRPYNAVTQFEPTDARKAFPCFDEPDLKATFSVTIKHARDLKALSNMQVISEQSDETKTVFAKSPLMSTYLVAFAVGKFDHIEAIASDGTQIGIWTPPNSGKSYELALTSAVRAYTAVREYFQTIEQPLKKIDFVGCASAVAAMENWGLVTFNEDFLPVKDGHQTASNFFNGLSVVTHELVHHWMGNLITMRWWNDMWLNEGFTVFITQVINQQLYPEYKYDLWSQITDFNEALKLDASDKSHPIRNTLALFKSGLQIEEVDDTITYGKSAALLRMLSDSIGAEMMQKSINKFVSANLYNNVAADDMIDSFAKTMGGLKVRKLMTSWLDQAGFPLVRAKLSPDSRTLMLTQERFGIQTPLGANDNEKNKKNKDIEEASKQKWIIPLRIAIGDGESVETIDEFMKDRQLTVSLPKSFNAEKTQSWLKLNANSGGYYRVIYDDARLMRAIMLAIDSKTLKAADRLNFYEDIIALTKIGLYSGKDLDTMIGWFKKETEEEILYKLARDILSFDSGSSSSSAMINWRKLLLNYYRKAPQSGPASDGGLHGQMTLERVERSLKRLGLLVEA